MTKPLDQQIRELSNKLKKELRDAVQSKKLYNEIGENVADQVRKRTRLGFGVSDSGQQIKLAKLENSTIEARKIKKKKGKLSQLSSPSKSHLTESAQLLDAITHEATNENVTIKFDNLRTGSDIGNRDLAIAMQKGDPKKNRKPRPFFALTVAEINALRRLVEKKIQELIKRLK